MILDVSKIPLLIRVHILGEFKLFVFHCYPWASHLYVQFFHNQDFYELSACTEDFSKPPLKLLEILWNFISGDAEFVFDVEVN